MEIADARHFRLVQNWSLHKPVSTVSVLRTIQLMKVNVSFYFFSFLRFILRIALWLCNAKPKFCQDCKISFTA